MHLDERLPRVYEAATRLLVIGGYKSTQMQDVARECGIATGSMYALFTGKRALLDYCLLSAYSGEALDVQTPVSEAAPGVLRAAQQRWRDALFAEFSGVSGRMSARAMAGALYDALSGCCGAILLLEKNGDVLGEESARYWELRRGFIAILEAEVSAYAARGELRMTPDARTMTLAMLTCVSMWALHAPYRYPLLGLDGAERRRIATDMIHCTYCELNGDSRKR